MKNVTALICALVLSFNALSLNLSAQAIIASEVSDPVEISLEAYVVTQDEEGEEVRTKADSAKPGDLILYEAIFMNSSSEAIEDLAPTIPIPLGLEYQDYEAITAPATVSIDGRNFFDFPYVRDAEGEPVDKANYRSVRWEAIQLAPEQTFTAKVYATVAVN